MLQCAIQSLTIKPKKASGKVPPTGYSVALGEKETHDRVLLDEARLLCCVVCVMFDPQTQN